MGRAEEDLHDELLERVARGYFIVGLLQNDIAAAEHLSRPSVSRLLAEARARGVVQFRIGPPVDRVRELEAELGRRTGLRRCVVATNKPRALYGTSSRLGYVAARYLESQLAGVGLLGVASSRSLSSLADSLAAGYRPDLKVVDLLGCLPGGRSDEAGGSGEGSAGEGRGPNTAQLIAARLDAVFRALPAPFVYRTGAARDAALGSELVRGSLELGQRCDLALVGVGSMQRFDGTGVYSPVTARELEVLAGQGAVGHLCGHFLCADGSLVHTEEAPFLLGIGADELRRIPQRIAVAAGRQKVAPIAAAISGGMISELVTDHLTADALLQLLHEQNWISKPRPRPMGGWV
ncbi:sugar-binding transcriptional regulator [Arthrobacter sp. Y81]|uniref:sugar-binding transcriptional regulator n=1 Tax=Arthrobacter sp. Y81 TaxID=2058897 RepID=UPI000CE3321B|nr:sugar-binding domain-containing protein [Arthrobacter sp. Y81]